MRISRVILQRRLERRSKWEGRAGVSRVIEVVSFLKSEAGAIVYHLSQTDHEIAVERLLRVHEVSQVLDLLLAQIHVEADVIEENNVAHRSRLSAVEEWRTSADTAKR